MRSSLLKISLLCAALGVIPAAQAAVEVTFVKPDQFMDIGSRSDQKDVLKELQKGFQKSADKYVPANQTLKIEVLDVDLAGRTQILPPPRNDIRLITGKADWPSIKLRYTLTADGKTIQSGEETMSDMSYQDGLNSASSQKEEFYYEKLMIGKWFRDHFSKAQASK